MENLPGKSWNSKNFTFQLWIEIIIILIIGPRNSWTQNFFLCSLLMTCWSHYFSFLHRALNLPSSFIYHIHDDFSNADPSNTGHILYNDQAHLVCTPACHESFKAQWSEHLTSESAEGRRFNSCWGFRLFLCPTLVKCWSPHFSWKIIVMFGRLVTEDVKAWAM